MSTRTLPPVPTVDAPRRYVDTHGHHGWLYAHDGRWRLEHCTDGHWGACLLGGPNTTEHEAMRLAYRDLRRKAHLGPLPELLKGTAHR